MIKHKKIFSKEHRKNLSLAAKNRKIDKQTRAKISKSVKIIKITHAGKRRVYDICVPRYKNFFLSNGILSHNSETKGMVDGQQDLTLLGRLPSEADRRQGTDQLRKDGFVTPKQITKLGTSEPGQFLICPSGRSAYYSYILLPRCRFWEESNGNFYNNVWKNEVDKWTSFEDERKRLFEKYKQDEEKEADSRGKSRKKGLKISEDINKEDDEIEFENTAEEVPEMVEIKPKKQMKQKPTKIKPAYQPSQEEIDELGDLMDLDI